MKTFNEIKQILHQKKPYLYEKYGVTQSGIFGSSIYGNQQKGSDIDLLVGFSQIPGLFKYMNLANYLSNLLDIQVDLVTEDGLAPQMRQDILNEVKFV